MNVQFGSGVLFGVPVSGNTPTNPTPWRFGVMQETQIGIKGDLKKLYGQKQLPVAKARGKVDVTGKTKLAVTDPNMLNQLYFSCPSAAGITLIADSEAQTVGGGTPAARVNTTAYTLGQTMTYSGFVYKCITAGTSAAAPPAFQTTVGASTADGTVVWQSLGASGSTVTVTNSATFTQDFGVQYAATGQQLICVAAAPQQGQYTVANGTYGFNASDAAAGVLISYMYTVATRGTTVTLSNQFMGFAPEFKALLYNMFRNKYFALQLNNCTASEIGIPTKQEDFWIVDFNFDACTDAADILGYLYADNV